MSAYTHCSNLFTWDGGKALREVWPGSKYAHSGAERTCCLVLTVSSYREESNHRRQTSLDLCWWLTRTSEWLLVYFLCGCSQSLVCDSRAGYPTGELRTNDKGVQSNLKHIHEKSGTDQQVSQKRKPICKDKTTVHYHSPLNIIYDVEYT